MFKFSFDSQVGEAAASETNATKCDENPVAPAEEIANDHVAFKQSELDRVTVTSSLVLLKGNVSTAQASSLLQDAELATSDLVPGRYEGGFKLWEGGLDLAKFLAEHPQFGFPDGMIGLRCLELGCGHGLPGLVALLLGAEVHFQDYNKEVLQVLTMPNVTANWANSANSSSQPNVRYFSGDWSCLSNLLEQHGLQNSYDVILSAETIYSLQTIHSLHNCIVQCLKKPGGVAFIAAKSYYFGVGGGVAAFMDVVRQHGELTAELVATINDGVSTKREILKLEFSCKT